jgi:hypothetical protein
MTGDAFESMLAERLRAQYESLPDADFGDVRSRARQIARQHSPHLRRLRGRSPVVLAVALVVVSGATAALARTFLTGDTSRPITATAVAALTQLPSVANPPSRLVEDIETSTSLVGGDETLARQTLRLLGSNLGTTHTDLFAYSMGATTHSDGRDVLCLFVWDRGGDCQQGADSLFPDVLLVASPGGPGYRGLPNNTPPTIAGLLADDVTSVTLTENGEQTALPIKNNSFFVELGEDPQASFTVTLHFTYQDGSSKDWDYTQQGPVRATPATTP